MGNENCYFCGKEIEVGDDELDDTLTVEVEGEEVADEGRSGAEVFLCAECKDKLLEEVEKVRIKK